MFRLVVLLSFDLCRSNSFHVNTRLGVGHHWWLDYSGPLLDAEFEFFLFIRLCWTGCPCHVLP